MKAEIKNTYECPFSDSHCFKRIDKLVVKDGMKYNEPTNIYCICPFFDVINDDTEAFTGKCKILDYIDYCITSKS